MKLTGINFLFSFLAMTMFLPNGVDTQKTLNFNMVETTYSPVKYMGSHFWSTTEILIKKLNTILKVIRSWNCYL